MAKSLLENIIKVQNQVLEKSEYFSIAIAGGSIPKFLGDVKDYPELKKQIKSEKWVVILTDEKCLPIDSDDLNMKAMKT